MGDNVLLAKQDLRGQIIIENKTAKPANHDPKKLN